MIVIASIHQPSTSTLLLFDNVLLLSEGKTVYFGPPSRSSKYFTDLGHPPQPFMSPAESMLHLINTDFAAEENQSSRLETLVESWQTSAERRQLVENIERGQHDNEVFTISGPISKGHPRHLAMQTLIQLHRMSLVNIPCGNLIQESVSGSSRLRCSNRHVSWSRNFDGDGLVTTVVFARKHSECSQCIVLRQCFHELHGTYSLNTTNGRRLRTSPLFWRTDPL
jgi:hypothetical protein